MSGGSWGYAYWKVLEMAYDLDAGDEDDCRDNEDENRVNPSPLRRALGKALENLAEEALKSIEWSDSGDYAHDDWVDPVREFLERRPIDLPAVREYYEQSMADPDAERKINEDHAVW